MVYTENEIDEIQKRFQELSIAIKNQAQSVDICQLQSEIRSLKAMNASLQQQLAGMECVMQNQAFQNLELLGLDLRKLMKQ